MNTFGYPAALTGNTLDCIVFESQAFHTLCWLSSNIRYSLSCFIKHGLPLGKCWFWLSQSFVTQRCRIGSSGHMHMFDWPVALSLILLFVVSRWIVLRSLYCCLRGYQLRWRHVSSYCCFWMSWQSLRLFSLPITKNRKNIPEFCSSEWMKLVDELIVMILAHAWDTTSKVIHYEFSQLCMSIVSPLPLHGTLSSHSVFHCSSKPLNYSICIKWALFEVSSKMRCFSLKSMWTLVSALSFSSQVLSQYFKRAGQSSWVLSILESQLSHPRACFASAILFVVWTTSIHLLLSSGSLRATRRNAFAGEVRHLYSSLFLQFLTISTLILLSFSFILFCIIFFRYNLTYIICILWHNHIMRRRNSMTLRRRKSIGRRYVRKRTRMDMSTHHSIRPRARKLKLWFASYIRCRRHISTFRTISFALVLFKSFIFWTIMLAACLAHWLFHDGFWISIINNKNNFY